MTRPPLKKIIRCNPEVRYFKPRGVPMRMLKEIRLSMEEVEALRLKDVIGLDQNEAALKMNTSQSTFQRIIASAHKKVALALIKGLAIRL